MSEKIKIPQNQRRYERKFVKDRKTKAQKYPSLPDSAYEKCSSKTKFDTEAKAKELLSDKNLGFRVYQCEVCSKWHLTSRKR